MNDKIIKSHLNEDVLNEINYKSIATAGLLGLSTLTPGTSTAAAKEVPKVVQKVTYPYTIDDIIAATLVDEAGGERDASTVMQGILNVINNRSSGDIRKSAMECLKPKQFSGWNPVNKRDIKSINQFIEKKRHHKSFPIALKLVADAKSGKLTDITGGADHFDNIELTKSVSGNYPSWYDPKRVTKKIGNVTFLKLNKKI